MVADQPYTQLRYLLEIDGLTMAGFSRCSLPTASTSVIEYREGNGPPTPRKLPGLNEYGPLVLETGVTDQSLELSEWRADVEHGDMEAARRPAAVTLLDAMAFPAARWEFRRAWPSQYDAPRLDATRSDVAIERLVVVHEGFGRVEVESGDDDEDDEADSEQPKPTIPRPEFPIGGGGVQGIEESVRTEQLSADDDPEET
ncbi:phage tail protein [Haloferax sp. YSSS75]|uniref:phage tail protein n=1 Tax=Haloferax sp. YSSS75 TaxID=3388564 RepID=UPI00398CD4A5